VAIHGGKMLTHAANKYSVFLRSVRQLLTTANAVPSSLILVTMMIETIRSSETPVLTRAMCNIQEDGILHSHCRENLISYKR
jgi:predicted hotdog family 3-hydroxylacyl-ACP dehydratase